jgi:hypothetical protein
VADETYGMAHFSNRSNTLAVVVLLTVTAFSCSMPIFTHVSAPTGAQTADKNFKQKPAKLTGILDLKGECTPGYYQVKLQGLFDGANTQVESQTDQSGHFSLIAPPGQYLMSVTKEGCGSKQTIELEENTEHMLAVTVTENRPSEKFGENGGRLPASILVLPKK